MNSTYFLANTLCVFVFFVLGLLWAAKMAHNTLNGFSHYDEPHEYPCAILAHWVHVGPCLLAPCLFFLFLRPRAIYFYLDSVCHLSVTPYIYIHIIYHIVYMMYIFDIFCESSRRRFKPRQARMWRH